MENQAAKLEREGNSASSGSTGDNRSLERTERQYLEAYYSRIARSQSVAARYILPTIALGGIGVVLYALANESHVPPSMWIASSALIVFVLVFGLYFGRNKMLRETEVKIDDRPLLLLEGPLELRGSSQSMLKLRVEGRKVSIPTLWPKLWYNPVRVWVYPTESGQHLAVDMEYLSEEAREKAAEEYHRLHGERGKTHFALAQELAEGRAKMEENYYGLY